MRFLFGTLLTLFLLLFYLQFLFECKKKLGGELVDRHLSEFVCCPSCHKEGATETDKKRDGKGKRKEEVSGRHARHPLGCEPSKGNSIWTFIRFDSLSQSPSHSLSLSRSLCRCLGNWGLALIATWPIILMYLS